MAFDQMRCQDILVGLRKYMTEDVDPITSRGLYGFTNALMSDRNLQGFSQIPLRLGDKVYGYKFARLTQNTVVSNAKVNVCTAPKEMKPLEYVFEPTLQRYTEAVYLRDEDLRRYCSNTRDELVNAMILASMDELFRTIDADLLGVLVTQFGQYYNTASNAAKAQPVLKAADGSPNMAGFGSMRQDYRQIHGRGNPVLVGSGIMERAFFALEEACCADGGINFGYQGRQFDFYPDDNVDTVLGANQAFMFQPGSLAFISRNDYVNESMVDSPTEKRMTMVDPYTGIPLDIVFVRDTCSGQWNMNVGLTFGLARLIRDDAWVAGSPMEGTNGTLRILAQSV
jgi:hypothetical protein